MWTLVSNGTEKTLADWGICEDFARERDNKGRGTVTLRTVEDFDAGATQWAAGGQAKIYRDRTSVGTGGSLWFQGWFDDPQRVNEGGIQHIVYSLHNVWWLLEQHFLQQARNCIAGISGPVSAPVYSYTKLYSCEVYLGETFGPPVAAQTNGAQIVEVLSWVNECFNATKRGATSGRDDSQDVIAAGTIEPRVPIPVTRAGAIYCAEAILAVLRLQPDSLVWVDESQAIPALNVRTFGKWNYGTMPPTFVDYTNLPEVTINITAEQETKILVQAQSWKALPGVVIWYWGRNTVDGQQVPFAFADVFPLGLSMFTPRISCHFIELEGFNKVTESADVETEPLSALLGVDQAGQVAWWLAHDQTLHDPKIDPATIVVGAPSVVDEDGAAIDVGTYPNILLDTPLPKWTADLGVVWKKAIVRAEIGFTQYADTAHHIVETKPRIRMVHKRVKVTNATTRTYTALKEFTDGEAAPAGVAESVYRSTNAVQHAGSITFTAAQLRSDVSIGCRLKLVGPTTTFQNILPQRIVEHPHAGTMEVTFGPAAPASIDFLLELHKATRFRMRYRMPSGRGTGEEPGASDNQVDTGTDAPTDDTLHGPGGNEFDAVTFQAS